MAPSDLLNPVRPVLEASCHARISLPAPWLGLGSRYYSIFDWARSSLPPESRLVPGHLYVLYVFGISPMRLKVSIRTVLKLSWLNGRVGRGNSNGEIMSDVPAF